MRFVSWNVNGLRAVARKGFLKWMRKSGADVIFTQEIRCRADQLEPRLRKPRAWRTHFVSAERPGYSGVGCFARSDREPDAVDVGLGIERFDREGRVQIAHFGALRVVNAYFPNGSGPNRDLSRVPYKLDFYRALFDHLEADRAQGRPILVLGDFNTAHRPIDLTHPGPNRKISGFLDVEREELDRWLREGWTDTFRAEHGDLPGQYTWWSNRPGIRARNVGWRIDLVLASPGVLPFLTESFIWPHVMGSDHCPIGVVVSDDVLERGPLGRR